MPDESVGCETWHAAAARPKCSLPRERGEVCEVPQIHSSHAMIDRIYRPVDPHHFDVAAPAAAILSSDCASEIPQIPR